MDGGRRSWKSVWLIVLLALFASGMATTAAATHDADGAWDVWYFQSLYNRSDLDCGGPRRPAFLCSGVLMRGTGTGIGYHVWEPNPDNQKKGGISFVWLRQDTPFRGIQSGYLNSGFLFIPVDDFGQWHYQYIEVLCTYPVDGYSDWRSNAGCGAERNYPTLSGPCQDQKPAIRTAEAWLDHYRRSGHGYESQCGFRVSIGTPDSANIFMQMVRSRQLMGNEAFPGHNEVILAEWPSQRKYPLPLLAFFYSPSGPGSTGESGLTKAQRYQADYFNTKGTWRAILRVTFPATATERASFTYASADQAVK